MHLARACARVGGFAHLPERPGEIDRRRPRREEDGSGFLDVLAPLGGERVPVRGRDPDRRGAAHGHRSDGLGDLRGRPAFELDLLVGQAPLVEDDDAILFQPDDFLGF
jgi:hypothetical protein